jgi:hypothetical protein
MIYLGIAVGIAPYSGNGKLQYKNLIMYLQL